MNPSGYAAETYESVRNKTVQPPVNPSVNGYECVRSRLLIRPNTPVNPSEENYKSVRKRHPTILAPRQLRHGLLYTLFTPCCYTLKNILINSDRFIVFKGYWREFCGSQNSDILIVHAQICPRFTATIRGCELGQIYSSNSPICRNRPEHLPSYFFHHPSAPCIQHRDFVYCRHGKEK